jgi:hypothetical protein
MYTPALIEVEGVRVSRLAIEERTPLAVAPHEQILIAAWTSGSPATEGLVSAIDEASGSVVTLKAMTNPTDGPTVIGDSAYVPSATDEAWGVYRFRVEPFTPELWYHQSLSTLAERGAPLDALPSSVTYLGDLGGPQGWLGVPLRPGGLFQTDLGAIDPEVVAITTAGGAVVTTALDKAIGYAASKPGCADSSGCPTDANPERGYDIYWFSQEPMVFLPDPATGELVGDTFSYVRFGPESGTLQGVIHPDAESRVWFVSRERTVTRFDPAAQPPPGSPLGANSVVDAGACPAADPLVGCRFLEEGSEGLVAFGAFWVGNAADGMLYRIDLETVEVTDMIEIGGTPGTPTATDDAVWVVDVETARARRIDPASRAVTNTVELPCEGGCRAWPSGVQWRFRPVGGGSAVWVPWDGALFRLELIDPN